MGGTIFISYRRGQDAGFAGRLFDRLERTFRRKALFMDVDSIAPGQDFVSILEARVAECDVLLALIGRGWLTATDEAGRRLDNAEDFVRIEIATALTQAKRVIPVLIDDVPMPRSEDLPEVLKPLVRRQATRLSHDRFKADSDRLIRAIHNMRLAMSESSPVKERSNLPGRSPSGSKFSHSQ
jgi:TIR domain